MPDERHESADLEDYEVLDGGDTLSGPPGDDPLDRGIVTPDHWSAAMRFGSTAAEQETGESLDELLAEEEPDIGSGGELGDGGWDENAPENDIADLSAGRGAGPRTGRLAYDDDDGDDDLARDEGIDGGGASAEEAAVHYLPDDEG